MAQYKTVKTSQGYTLQQLHKVLCFNIWRSVCSGSVETIDSYINNSIKGGAIILTNY